MTLSLRPLDLAGDRAVLASLWEAALAPAWPLLPAGLDVLLGGLVAEAGGRALGAVGVDPAGGIQLLVVDPAAQRRGVGTALLEAAIAQLRAAGVRSVNLGSAGGGRIWPGVPEDLPGAVAFFERGGWRWQDVVHDLAGDLRGYRTPAGVHERAAAAGVTYDLPAGRERAQVVAFEAEHFPTWQRFFEDPGARMLAARGPDGEVAGSLLIEGPGSAKPFDPMLGPMAGSIGCVGVAGRYEGHGIGTAMVARASELLAERGARMCHIGWTVRSSFYGRLGYRHWRSYKMSRRSVDDFS